MVEAGLRLIAVVEVVEGAVGALVAVGLLLRRSRRWRSRASAFIAGVAASRTGARPAVSTSALTGDTLPTQKG